ncbi:mitochondrial ribosomal protein L37 [Xylocopa sonorina]|uniref:mitochondrial ribosomal protein L37 n=1 Tax=Xylocopa sonorina TaxID=1818115 RepID=UPI00403B292A
MKFTQLLYKQHIGKALRYLWYQQRERNIRVTKAHDVLASMNIPVVDAKELKPLRNEIPLCNSETIEEPITLNEIDTNQKSIRCLMLGDCYTLQKDIPQACLLTKTVKIANELPDKVKDLITDIPDNINNIIKRFVSTSVIYDAQQVKLPKLKDPERPAWVFPRAYGISSTRKMLNLSKKFLQLSESLNGLNIAQHRSIVHGGLSSMCIEKENNLFKFSLKMDLMMTSSTPLSPIADVNVANTFDMPNLHPLHYTIGLTKLNINETEDLYPISMESPLSNVHTIFINHDPEEVKNITELPVTQKQIYARSLIKSFGIAANCARRRFGSDVKHLPEPVVVQCVQSDGQNFHFSVYQLNTLDLDGVEGIRNFWWSEPSMKLYTQAQYEKGKPCLEGYTSDVFKRFHAFYNNQ